MKNKTHIPDHLQKRKRVSSTTFGVRPMLLESTYALFHDKCKADNIPPAKVASILLTKYAKGEISI